MILKMKNLYVKSNNYYTITLAGNPAVNNGLIDLSMR